MFRKGEWHQLERADGWQRARFEYHPENVDTSYEILLGQFGRQILGQVSLLQGNPGFFALYTTNAALRAQLGAPTGAAFQTVGTAQPFQQGQMYGLEQGGTLFPIPGADPPTRKLVYALCGDPSGGLSTRSGMSARLPTLDAHQVWSAYTVLLGSVSFRTLAALSK